MKIALAAALACIVLSLSPAAHGQGFQNELLDHFAGDWTLRGNIAGGERVHEISAEWVLGHQYLRFHELSHEKNSDGTPEYIATVYLGWDAPSNRYACLWLDSTGGGGLSSEAIGYAEPNGDVMQFLFGSVEAGLFHTSFRYERESDTWQWSMDVEKDGELTLFARATMSRR